MPLHFRDGFKLFSHLCLAIHKFHLAPGARIVHRLAGISRLPFAACLLTAQQDHVGDGARIARRRRPDEWLAGKLCGVSWKCDVLSAERNITCLETVCNENLLQQLRSQRVHDRQNILRSTRSIWSASAAASSPSPLQPTFLAFQERLLCIGNYPP